MTNRHHPGLLAALLVVRQATAAGRHPELEFKDGPGIPVPSLSTGGRPGRSRPARQEDLQLEAAHQLERRAPAGIPRPGGRPQPAGSTRIGRRAGRISAGCLAPGGYTRMAQAGGGGRHQLARFRHGATAREGGQTRGRNGVGPLRGGLKCLCPKFSAGKWAGLPTPLKGSQEV